MWENLLLVGLGAALTWIPLLVTNRAENNRLAQRMEADYRKQDKKLLFEAREKAFSGVLGRAGTFFIPVISEGKKDLESLSVVAVELQMLLADVQLLGSELVLKKSQEYFEACVGFLTALSDEKSDTSAQVSSLAVMEELYHELVHLMKQDLFGGGEHKKSGTR